MRVSRTEGTRWRDSGLPVSHAMPMQIGGDRFRERALSVFPSGSNGEYGIPPELIPVIERGHGCRVWSSEGREYLDMTMAWGAALVGHAHPSVLQRATDQASQGANFAGVNCRSVELAERLRDINPLLEKIRFVASGTEATLLCLRVALTATGRRKVLRFEGAYHGQHPIGVAGMLHGQPSALPHCDSSGAGAPWVESDVLVAPFNDIATTQSILRTHGSSIGAVKRRCRHARKK